MRLIVFLSLFVYIVFAVPPASAQFNDQNSAEIRNMSWKPATGLSLSRSRATLTSLPDYVGVTDAQAARIETIAGNNIPGVEAHLANGKSGAEAVLSYGQTGFVRSDDWDKIDAQQFLSEISKCPSENILPCVSRLWLFVGSLMGGWQPDVDEREPWPV